MIAFETDSANEGRFLLTDAQEGGAALDRLLDRYDGGGMIGKDFVDHLKALIKRYPESIDAHAHLGTALMEQGLVQEGLKFGKRGLKLGIDAMPKAFDGTLSWYELGNQSMGEEEVGVGAFLDLDLQQRADIGVERGFPELAGVHFAQALVALQRHALAGRQG